MRVVFFGSPDFAVASLEALLKSSHEVVGVITQPDRPAGRGLELTPSAVKKLALAAKLPIFQPEKLNNENTYAWLADRKPDVLAVVAYGEFLGEKLLNFCPQPPINVHPSLLPDLRGAAPMQWALLRGYKNSGVTTQFMVKEMDAGPILRQESCSIGIDENAQELQERLRLVGARLLVETIDAVASGTLQPAAQDASLATLAPLLSKEQGLIHWQRDDAATIHNQVRGLFPWPSAFSFLQGKRCKVLRTRVPNPSNCPQRDAQAGEFAFFGDALFVRARDAWIEVLQIQPEGKRALLPREFASGINTTDAIYFDPVGDK